MKRNFRYITRFEEETRSARLEQRGAQPRSDEISEQEIYLTIINDYDKNSGRLKSIILNQARKINNGKFDSELSPKAFEYLVEDGLKSYARYNGKISLSPASRQHLGKRLSEYYMDDIEALAEQLKEE